jgi:hypothetical protein
VPALALTLGVYYSASVTVASRRRQLAALR